MSGCGFYDPSAVKGTAGFVDSSAVEGTADFGLFREKKTTRINSQLVEG
jgi:hypothetical protein